MASLSRNGGMEGGPGDAPGGPADFGQEAPQESFQEGAHEPSRNAPRTCAAPVVVSDESLILRIAAQRDRTAFIELFERYGARIKAYMIRGGAAPDDAEEAAQEALLAVWRRAETFDPTRSSAAAWLFTVARNKRIDLFRRGGRKDTFRDDPSLTPDAPVRPDAASAAESRDHAVRAALAGLNAAQREVIFMAFFDGFSQSEISQRLNIPLGTVKSRLRLAFSKLRDALGADFHEELFD